MSEDVNRSIRIVRLPSVFGATPEAYAKMTGLSVEEVEGRLASGELPSDPFGQVLLSDPTNAQEA